MLTTTKNPIKVILVKIATVKSSNNNSSSNNSRCQLNRQKFPNSKKVIILNNLLKLLFNNNFRSNIHTKIPIQKIIFTLTLPHRTSFSSRSLLCFNSNNNSNSKASYSRNSNKFHSNLHQTR